MSNLDKYKKDLDALVKLGEKMDYDLPSVIWKAGERWKRYNSKEILSRKLMKIERF